MPNRHYVLTHAKSSWKKTLHSLAGYLPANVAPDDLHTLRPLPIFAVVVVIDNQVLHAQDKDPTALVQAWGEDNGWAVGVVPTELNHAIIHAPKEATAISDVSVFRFVIIPKNPAQITPEKRDAAAHIVDEQLTAHLKRKLKTKADYEPTASDFDNANFELIKAHEFLDCHIVSVAQMLYRHKLACFDMDSTLIKQEVIVELAKMAGIGDEVNEITEQAMRGEIDFATSFINRVGLLAGLDETIIDDIKPLLIPQSGAFITIAALKAMGYRTVLISGGFEPFAKYVANLLGMDDYYANPLEISDGKLTGVVSAPILDGNQKASIVARLAETLGISLFDVICVGDGANDLPMMALADLGVAYHAKPIVQVKADAAINVTGLEGVLYTLGYPALTAKHSDKHFASQNLAVQSGEPTM